MSKRLQRPWRVDQIYKTCSWYRLYTTTTATDTLTLEMFLLSISVTKPCGAGCQSPRSDNHNLVTNLLTTFLVRTRPNQVQSVKLLSLTWILYTVKSTGHKYLPSATEFTRVFWTKRLNHVVYRPKISHYLVWAVYYYHIYFFQTKIT